MDTRACEAELRLYASSIIRVVATQVLAAQAYTCFRAAHKEANVQAGRAHRMRRHDQDTPAHTADIEYDDVGFFIRRA